MEFLETIAACDLKVGRCRQLVDLMNKCQYSSVIFDACCQSVEYRGNYLVNKNVPMGLI